MTRGFLALCSLLLLGAPALIVGCASSGPKAYVDPVLEDDGIHSGAIAVLGVTALAGPDDRDTRFLYREALSGGMAQARPDLRFVEGSEAWIALGDDEATAILDAYRGTARLGPNEIARLSVLSDRARFVLVGRIDLDLDGLDTDHRTRESLDRVVIDVDVRGRREMSATFDLFDLQTRRMVFSTQISRVETEPGRSFEVDPLQQPPTNYDIDRAIREKLPTIQLPDPPGRLMVLRRMIQDAAEDLPGGS